MPCHDDSIGFRARARRLEEDFVFIGGGYWCLGAHNEGTFWDLASFSYKGCFFMDIFSFQTKPWTMEASDKGRPGVRAQAYLLL